VGRKLPDAITRNAGESDEAFDVRRASSKRRLKLFKNIYRQYFEWQSLREAGHIGDIITLDGEDFYIGDLLIGFNTLPPQQKRAFDLICLRSYTESEATKVILPLSQWSTPVQQYSDDGLRKMVAAYDAKQRGEWDPRAAVARKRPSRKKEPEVTTAVDTPEVPDDVDDETLPKFSRVDHLDWSVCSEDNASLADYINAKTGLGITGQQVKAVAFLRKPWYSSPERVEHREQVAEAKKQDQAKFAYETPEQREKRFEAARRLKSAEAARERAQKLQDEVCQLRIEAGLDPETGDPVAAK
jgi:hypothetical protein